MLLSPVVLLFTSLVFLRNSKDDSQVTVWVVVSLVCTVWTIVTFFCMCINLDVGEREYWSQNRWFVGAVQQQ